MSTQSQRVRRIIAAAEIAKRHNEVITRNREQRQPLVIRPHVLDHDISSNVLPLDGWLALTQRGYIIR